MKISKAIELLQTEYDTADRTVEPDFYHALKLGIEALKVFHWSRTHKYPSNSQILPGEEPEA